MEEAVVDDISLVHWHEGLFLRPHQLQHMQRSLVRRMELERRLRYPFPTGLIDFEMSEDSLENYQIRVDRLWAAMPSGLIIRYPEDASLPPLEFKDQFQSSAQGLTIYIAVPHARSPGPDVVDDLDDPAPWRRAVRQRVELRELYDENTGKNPSREPVRRTNARLLTENDPHDEMEVLPILRLIRSTADAEGRPRRDPNWVPSALVLSGVERLRLLVRDLAQYLDAQRDEMMQSLSTATYQIEDLQGVGLAQFFRLRTLGRFAVRLGALAASPRVTTPFEAWREMSECLQELASLSPGKDDGRIRAFNHDAPGPLFEDLDRRIRALAGAGPGRRPEEIAFRREQALYVAEIPADKVGKSIAWYLGVQTNDDANTVNAIVEDELNFQLLPQSFMRRRVPGVPLEYDRVGHRDLQPKPGLYYYRLNLASDMWKRVVDEGNAVIKFTEFDKVDWQLTLYGIAGS